MQVCFLVMAGPEYKYMVLVLLLENEKQSELSFTKVSASEYFS